MGGARRRSRPPSPPYEPDASVEALHWELSQLKDSIDHMKMEVAALRSDKAPAAPWEKATCELDAVVRATETATHTILEAAEQIDVLLVALRHAQAEPDEAVNRVANRWCASSKPATSRTSPVSGLPR